MADIKGLDRPGPMDLLRPLCLSVIAYLALTDLALTDGAPGGNDALGFARRVFEDLGDNLGDVAKTAARNQAEFDAMDGEAGKYLLSLMEMRVADLRTTLEHTEAMQRVVGLLVQNRAVGAG